MRCDIMIKQNKIGNDAQNNRLKISNNVHFYNLQDKKYNKRLTYLWVHVTIDISKYYMPAGFMK